MLYYDLYAQFFHIKQQQRSILLHTVLNMLIYTHSIEAVDFWYQHFGYRMIPREPLDDGVTRTCLSCGRETDTPFMMGKKSENRYKCHACYSYSCGAPKLGIRTLTGNIVLVRPNNKSRLITRPVSQPYDWVINKEEVGGTIVWTGSFLLNLPPPPYLFVHLNKNRDLQRLRITHGPDTLYYCNGDAFPVDLPLIHSLAEKLLPVRSSWARLRQLLLQEQFVSQDPFQKPERHPELTKLESEQPEIVEILRNFPPGRGHWMALNCIFKQQLFQEKNC